jgi:hypothetical protein
VSELAERWRVGLANALGDVPVEVDRPQGMLRLSARWRVGDEVQACEAYVALDAEPTPEHFELLAEEMHGAGYPRP